MRVYIPATVDELALQTSGQWEPQRAFAVTDLLREAIAALDEDELVEFAIDAAAMASALDGGSRLRAVIAADVSRADAVPDAVTHPAAVLVAGRLDPAAIACVFVDEEDAASDAKAAAAGDDDAAERLADRTLLWYDLAEVLGD
ncbi:hypothetical protein [Demequina sp.]|uniref:DUF6912 family protein n=1 Tax=Demequina sp. TaxID=2050685 RepID=UPI0025C098CA|nr:hypothetical protein [Demequina sp.]